MKNRKWKEFSASNIEYDLNCDGRVVKIFRNDHLGLSEFMGDFCDSKAVQQFLMKN